MSLLRAPLLGLFMALVMVLTGHAMALARAAHGPVGFAELCTGVGPVMVPLDENGTPIGPPHICPDFALHGFDLGVQAQALPQAPRTLSRLNPPLAPAIGATLTSATPRARDPPSLS